MQTVQVNILTGPEYAKLCDGRGFGNKYHSLGLWVRDTKKDDRAESYEKLCFIDKVVISAAYKKLKPCHYTEIGMNNIDIVKHDISCVHICSALTHNTGN